PVLRTHRSSLHRAVDPPADRLDHPGGEDHALEQRVGGEPVGPVDARAGHLARGPQAGKGRRPVEVGDDAPTAVVGGGGDGQPVGGGVQAGGGQGGGDGGEAGAEVGQAG